AAILFIVIIALAGLGIVVVKALGGEEVPLSRDVRIKLPEGAEPKQEGLSDAGEILRFPAGCAVRYTPTGDWTPRPESFLVRAPEGKWSSAKDQIMAVPEGAVVLVPGSSWGAFTIACTIPIALLVGLYMYKIRKGRVLEASLLGA